MTHPPSVTVHGLLQSSDSRPNVDIYAQLSSASPLERRSLVVALVAQHPSNILDLPLQDGRGANLNEINLSQHDGTLWDESSKRQISPNSQIPAVNLARAVLPGATFESANLSGLDFSFANLSGAVLRRANLSRANLEQSNLENADLAGAHLSYAAIGKSNLQFAKLEDADLSFATMRFCQLRNAVLEGTDLQSADLWGADLRSATLRGADSRDATFSEADLRGADASNADFRNASFDRAQLANADLANSDLRGAQLRGANLHGACLRGAYLSDVDLSGCDICNAYFADALLDRTRMNVAQLVGGTGEDLSGDHEAARRSYLALEMNFRSFSNSNGVSWAYCKRRRMQKKVALGEAIDSLRSREISRGSRSFARYVSDLIVEYACDYGESIPRVFLSLLVIYLLFILVYGITGSVTRIVDTPLGPVPTVTRDVTDLAIFSLLAMTTSGSPSVGLQPRHELVYLLTGVQALIGIGLTGLLGFVVGNRIRR